MREAVTQLQVYTMSLTGSSEITNFMSEADGVSEQTADKICALVNAAACPPSNSGSVEHLGSSANGQAHGHPEAYLTPSEWETVRDIRVPVTTKVSTHIHRHAPAATKTQKVNFFIFRDCPYVQSRKIKV